MSMPLAETVAVIVDGYELSGWQEIDVRRSMQNAAIAFTLKATHAAWSAAAVRLRKAEEIEIRASGDLICTGAVDSYEADIGEGQSKIITLHGRSQARDAIDCPPCNHPTGRVEGKDLKGVAQDLGGEFAVTWDSDIALSPIDKVQWRPGETLYETIERQARLEAAMLLGRPDGSILITRAGTKRHAGALVEGRPPVNRVSVKLVPAAERSEIHVRGQRAGGWGAQNLRQSQVFRPATPGKRRHRTQLVLLEGDRGGNRLKTRGKWHHLRSFAGNVVAPRVSRWRDEDGLLWEPGRLMALRVPSEGVDVDFVLAEATFRQGLGADSGTRAELVFTDPRDLGGAAPAAGYEDANFNPYATIATD